MTKVHENDSPNGKITVADAIPKRIERLADAMSYPPRAFRAERAAAYLSISKAAFLRLVGEGELPPPVRIHGIVSWDRLDLDAAYENWKGREAGNTMHRLLRTTKVRPSQISVSKKNGSKPSTLPTATSADPTVKERAKKFGG